MPLSQEQKEANKKRRKANRQAKMQRKKEGAEQFIALTKTPEFNEKMRQELNLRLERMRKENPHFDFEIKKDVPEKLFCNTCEVEISGLYGCEKGVSNNSQD